MSCPSLMIRSFELRNRLKYYNTKSQNTLTKRFTVNESENNGLNSLLFISQRAENNNIRFSMSFDYLHLAAILEIFVLSNFHALSSNENDKLEENNPLTKE